VLGAPRSRRAVPALSRDLVPRKSLPPPDFPGKRSATGDPIVSRASGNGFSGSASAVLFTSLERGREVDWIPGQAGDDCREGGKIMLRTRLPHVVIPAKRSTRRDRGGTWRAAIEPTPNQTPRLPDPGSPLRCVRDDGVRGERCVRDDEMRVCRVCPHCHHRSDVLVKAALHTLNPRRAVPALSRDLCSKGGPGSEAGAAAGPGPAHTHCVRLSTSVPPASNSSTCSGIWPRAWVAQERHGS
jgi:hypothetical protein